MNMTVIKLPFAAADTTLPVLYRDPLIASAGGGVKWAFDLASRYSWPPQAAPVNADAVINLNESGSNGQSVVATPGAITYAGGGFDFATAAKGNVVQGSADLCNSLDANQYFLVCVYIKAIADADWPTSGNGQITLSFADSGNYVTNPELVDIRMSNLAGARVFLANRQSAIGTTERLSINATADHFGQFAQVAFWRNAAGRGLRVKTAAGVSLATNINGTANTASLAGLSMRAGLPQNNPAALGTNNKFRLYRGFGENLAISGRDPVTVLDADWSRTIARGAFS